MGQLLVGRSTVVPERRAEGRARRFDIRVDHRGIEFVLEASYDSQDAVEDARRRIEEGLIRTVAIAVHYPRTAFEGIEDPTEIQEVLKTTELGLKVFSQGSDISQTLQRYLGGRITVSKERTPDWIRIQLDEFPKVLDGVLECVVAEDLTKALGDEVEQKTFAFIEAIGAALARARQSDATIGNLNRVLFTSSPEATIPDVPSDVVLAHAYISLLMASTLYESVAIQHGLPPLQAIMRRHRDPFESLHRAYELILEVDYRAVFDVALAVVDCIELLHTDSRVSDIVRDVVSTACGVVVKRALLRRDFIGQVFHKVTGDVATRKGYATFYTKAPAAYLLASLALTSVSDREGKVAGLDWSDFRASFRVGDLACGSGTLLSAAYSTLQDLYRHTMSELEKPVDYGAFHRDALESCFWGFDALEHATQIASVVLTLHEPGVPLSLMHTYHVPVDRSGSLGSLNYWRSDRQLVPVERRGIEKAERVEVVLPRFDLIIMNPPFSRATAPGQKDSRPRIFDFMTAPGAYGRLWSSYSDLLRNLELSERLNATSAALLEEYVGEGRVFASGNVDPLKAGAALPFFFLADRYLKPGGCLALVLPRTALESSSFFLLRAALMSRYRVEFLVVSSEEGNSNFSYSTQFSEVLVVARKARRGEDLRSVQTTVVNLHRQPKDVLAAILLGREVLNSKPQRGSRAGVAIERAEAELKAVPHVLLREFVWNMSPLLALPPTVETMIEGLVEGSLFGIPLRLSRLMDVPGVDVANPRRFRGDQFGDHFSRSKAGPLLFLPATGKEVMSALELDKEQCIAVSPKDAKATSKYTSLRGRVLIPEAIRFNSSPLVSCWSPTPLVSSRAHMIRFDQNPRAEKALCVWLNSSFGISFLHTFFTTVEEEFGHIYGWHLRMIRVPDFSSETVVNGLSAVFDRFARSKWPSLPDQYAANFEQRPAFDIAVLRSLAASAGTEVDTSHAESDVEALHAEMPAFL